MPIRHPIKTCKSCSSSFNPTGARQVYCVPCGLDAKRNHSLNHYYKNHDKEKQKRNLSSRYRITYNTLESLLSHAKNRANKKNIEFSISKEDLFVPACCPILGTSFEVRTPYAMSIDRIDPTKGYIKGNVQVISRKANTMKSNGCKEELLKLADWIYKNYKDN